MTSLWPQSNGEPLIEFNGCHSPENGKFCSTDGGGGAGSDKEDTEVTIQRVDFPNGPRFSVVGKQTGKRLFPPPGTVGLKSEAGLQRWLKKSGWVADDDHGPSFNPASVADAHRPRYESAYGHGRIGYGFQKNAAGRKGSAGYNAYRLGYDHGVDDAGK